MRAAVVQEEGTPALQEAVMNGEVPLLTAAEIAKQEPEVQDQAVEEAKKPKRKRGAKSEPKPEKPEEPAKPPEDEVGLVVTGKMATVFESRTKFKQVIKLLRQAQSLIDEIATAPGGEKFKEDLQLTGSEEKQRWRSRAIDDAVHAAKTAMPHSSVCPWCHHEHPGEFSRSCKACRARGWVIKTDWDNVEESYRKAVLKKG
jgi:hypothetical protein